MAPKKKGIGQPGKRRANLRAQHFLAEKAAAIGSWAALAREVRRPEQTLGRVAAGEGLRDATADDYENIFRELGFVGLTGLERPSILKLRTPPDSTPPAAA